MFIFKILIVINFIGFVSMALDKFLAIKQMWRIPEIVLLLIAAMGGSVGCLAGMYLFRHKTRHLKFVVGVPLIIVGHLLILYFTVFRYMNLTAWHHGNMFN